MEGFTQAEDGDRGQSTHVTLLLLLLLDAGDGNSPVERLMAVPSCGRRSYVTYYPICFVLCEPIRNRHDGLHASSAGPVLLLDSSVFFFTLWCTKESVLTLLLLSLV